MRDVVLSAYNRATYLDQTLVTMWEKCVGKVSFARAIYHV